MSKKKTGLSEAAPDPLLFALVEDLNAIAVNADRERDEDKSGQPVDQKARKGRMALAAAGLAGDVAKLFAKYGEDDLEKNLAITDEVLAKLSPTARWLCVLGVGKLMESYLTE